MADKEIVALAFILSTIVIVIWKEIKKYKDKMFQDTAQKRFDEIKSLIKDGKVSVESIDLSNNPNRLEENAERKVIIDGKDYTNKEYYFAVEEGKIYIFGKKENRVIILTGKIGDAS